MPFDGLTIRALTQELNTDLFNARIDKIYQPEKDEIILVLRQQRIGNFRLLISANPRWSRMHITSEKRENPKQAPTFCMLLRKHLEGGKIKEVKQLDFERIVHIKIEALDDFREWKEKILVCEFMGRHSNVILINPETNVIIDAIHRFGDDVSSYREVLPGKTYKTPPSQDKYNPLITSYYDFSTIMWNQYSDFNIADAFFKTFSGISPFSAKELCINAGLEPIIPVEQCGEFEFSKLHKYLMELLNEIGEGVISPSVIVDKSIPIEYAAFKLDKKSKQFSSMNAACDYYYVEKLNKIRLDSVKSNLLKHLKVYLDKAYKKLFYQQGDLEKALKNNQYKVWGELITAYSYQLEKGQKSAILEDFYTGELVTIDLDSRYSPIENAQKYFKIYNKSQKAIKHLEHYITQNEAEIKYLESVCLNVALADNYNDISEIVEELESGGYVKERSKGKKSTEEKSQPRKFLSSEGYTINVGRNNRQNDFLTMKDSDKSDLWLHAKNIPGSHVIINFNKKIDSINEVPDKTLEEAAGLAAYYSKASEVEKVEVDYTFRLNVKKPPGAKPGMVTYNNFWTIVVNPQSDNILKLINKENIHT